jgi:predicted Zn-dependent peptidase
MVDDSPEEALGDMFNAAFFPGQALGRNISGTPATVRTFGSVATRRYHERMFSPQNLVVVAAGNVDHDQVLALISDLTWPKGDIGRGNIDHAPAPAPAFAVKQRSDLEQAHFILATPFVGATDGRRYAADLLGTIIGGGTSSRLWQKVREERGLAYSIGAGAVMYQDTGVFSVSAATSPEQTREVVQLSLSEMRDIAANGVTDEELELAKQQAVSSVLLSLEDSASRAAALAQSEMIHRRQIGVDETLAGFAAVTRDDCHSLAAEFFRTECLAFAAVGNAVDLDRSILVI